MKIDWLKIAIHFFFVLCLGVSTIVIIGVFNKFNFQGNHDTPVIVQGNHDTTVQVKEELCDAAIQKVIGVEIKEGMHVKTHTIAGRDGETVANVIVMYKDFPFVIKLEGSK